MASNMPESYPKVGIGVMVMNAQGQVLMCKRAGSHGAGEYSFPGGHLEYMESIEDCARRECREEAGIEIKNIRFHFAANVRKYAPKHYVHIGFFADWKSGEPTQREPDRGDAWKWYDMDKMPAPLFCMCEIAVRAYENDMRGASNFFDDQDLSTAPKKICIT